MKILQFWKKLDLENLRFRFYGRLKTSKFRNFEKVRFAEARKTQENENFQFFFLSP